MKAVDKIKIRGYRSVYAADRKLVINERELLI